LCRFRPPPSQVSIRAGHFRVDAVFIVCSPLPLMTLTTLKSHQQSERRSESLFSSGTSLFLFSVIYWSLAAVHFARLVILLSPSLFLKTWRRMFHFVCGIDPELSGVCFLDPGLPFSFFWYFSEDVEVFFSFFPNSCAPVDSSSFFSDSIL